MTDASLAPATKHDIERLHDRLGGIDESLHTLATECATVNERCKIRGAMLLEVAQTLRGKPGNGAEPGLIRTVDANTRHRRRTIYWLKWAATLASALIVTAAGAGVAWALGMIRLP